MAWTDWFDYRLADFILFSADNQERLLIRYSEAIWPLHFGALSLGVLAVLVMARPAGSELASRVLFLVLAASWVFIGKFYFIDRFSLIAPWGHVFGFAFIVEGLLLAAIGLVHTRTLKGSSFAANPGLWAAAFALLAFLKPAIDILSGKGLHETALFGLAPDETAMGTLLVLVMLTNLSSLRSVLPLLAIPSLWCLASGLTSLGLGHASGALMMGIGLGFPIIFVPILIKCRK